MLNNPIMYKNPTTFPYTYYEKYVYTGSPLSDYQFHNQYIPHKSHKFSLIKHSSKFVHHKSYCPCML